MSAESALGENGEEFLYVKRSAIDMWHNFETL